MILMLVCLIVMLMLPPLLVWAADEVAPAAPAAAAVTDTPDPAGTVAGSVKDIPAKEAGKPVLAEIMDAVGIQAQACKEHMPAAPHVVWIGAVNALIATPESWRVSGWTGMMKAGCYPNSILGVPQAWVSSCLRRMAFDDAEGY